MKKILTILLVLTMIFTFSACSVSGIVKGLTGGALDVGSNMKWPKDKMGSVPELKGAKINSILNLNEGTSLVFTDLSTKDAEAYYKKLKDVSKDISIMGKDENNKIWFTGYINNAEVVFFCYDGSGTLATSVKEYEKYTYQIFYGDEAKWDNKALKNIPELKNIIVTVMTINDDSVSIMFNNTDVNNVKKYIDTLKSSGFSEDFSSEYDNGFMFSGSKGDISVFITYNSDSTDFGSITVN
ncbi:MAG: hypothetical protein FWF15_04815 [Oscillospiraceae bacterium]|nr:hypothetical protein [Oscillospiraceae bacterium]